MQKTKRLLVSVFVLLSAFTLWAGSCFADNISVVNDTSVPSSSNFFITDVVFNYSNYPTSFVATSDSSVISSFSSTNQFTYSETGSFSFPALEDSGNLILPWNGGYNRDTSSSGSSAGSSAGTGSSTISQSGLFFFPCTLTITVYNDSDKFRYLSDVFLPFRSPTHLIYEDSSFIVSSSGNSYTLSLPSTLFTPYSYHVFSVNFLAHATTPQRPAFPSSFIISGGASSRVIVPSDQDVAGLIKNQTDQQRDQYNEATSAGNSSAYDSIVSDSSSVRGFGDSVEAVAVPVLQLFDGSRTFGEPDLVLPGLYMKWHSVPFASGFVDSIACGSSLPNSTFNTVWPSYTFNFRTFFEQYNLGFLKTALNFGTVFVVYSGLLKYLLDVWDKLMNGVYAGDIN